MGRILMRARGVAISLALTVALLSIGDLTGAQAALIEHLPLDGNGTASVGTSGTLVNGPIPAADRFGTPSGALAFSGASLQYVNVAGGGGLNNLQTSTISMFVKWTGTQDAACCSSNGNVLARQSNGAFSNDVIGLSTTKPATAGVTWQPYSATRLRRLQLRHQD